MATANAKPNRPVQSDVNEVDRILELREYDVEETPKWEKTDAETALAYKAFTVYRDLGPTRTLRGAWEAFVAEDPKREYTSRPGATRINKGRAKSQQQESKVFINDRGFPPSWGTWSGTHSWRERAESWDFFNETVKRDELTAEQKANIEEYKKSVRSVSQRKLAAFSNLFVVGNERLRDMRENDHKAKEQERRWRQMIVEEPTLTFKTLSAREQRLYEHDLEEYRQVSVILRNASMIADSGLSAEGQVLEVNALLIELNTQRQKDEQD